VKSPRVTRRLVAGAAGLLVGATGALVLASPASAHHPIVDGSAVCDEQTGEWIITWTVENSETDLTGLLTAVTVSPDAALSVITEGATLPVQGDGPLQEEQRVPGDIAQASLEVTVEWVRPYRKIVKSGAKDLELGGECAAPPAEEEPPAEEPTGEWDFDCQDLTISFTNPSKEELTLTFVPSVGEPADVTVPGGESVGVEFPSSAGLTVEILLGEEPVTLEEPVEITPAAWEASGCEDDEGSGEGGGLPETGAPTALIAGGALALLALGGGLFLVARRRRVTFTA
jgi:LPXTG-motif cell wall-anchored protein